MNMQKNKNKPSKIILYPADKHGCGFYRTFYPFRYLAVCDENYEVSELFAFNFDINFIKISDHIRFQRQVTISQTKIISFYKENIKKFGFPTKLSYDLDDLVHEIMPHNTMAYKFYTQTRKNNLIEIFRICDFVTFSTKFLKDYYEEKFNIKNSYVVPNFLPHYVWKNLGKRDKRKKENRPRILWAGSSSHIGKGGDLEFLIPLIEKTLNEFHWIFFGTAPPELEGKVEKHKWRNVIEYPNALDEIDADIAIAPIADSLFNLAKSDLKILEYSALGFPVICSSIGNKKGPYDLVPGLLTLENKIDLWYSAIKELWNNEESYQKYLQAGKAELAKRWLESSENIGIYKELYKSNFS
ncbi:MAG: hypothetical protein NZZ41_01245 [Candidatus Dojkabacteria bacterium]|nr:hypothetical protein [Candidatus Dojkabacteria bacterium]